MMDQRAQERPNNRRFWLLTLLAAVLLTGVVNSEMLRGRVPFPTFFLFEFGPFAKAAPPGPIQVPANIGDVATQFYLFHGITGRAVRGGEFPLWNPYLLSGTPLLASAQ